MIQPVPQEPRVDAATFLAGRLLIPAAFAFAEELAQEREIDADKGRQAEPLVLEFILARNLRLPVVIDEDEPAIGQHPEQPVEAVNRPITVQEPLRPPPPQIDRELRVRHRPGLRGSIVVLRGKQPVDLQQFLAGACIGSPSPLPRGREVGVKGNRPRRPLAQLLRRQVGVIGEANIAGDAGADIELPDRVAVELQHRRRQAIEEVIQEYRTERARSPRRLLSIARTLLGGRG